MAVTRDELVGQLQIINKQYNFNYKDLKSEQIDVIHAIIENKDVVAVLPTGFGKTFCFTAPSLVLDRVSDCVVSSFLINTALHDMDV